MPVHINFRDVDVVPYVGTWIEILRSASTFQKYVVVPYVGTWIEMTSWREMAQISMSFPTWERG
mgnify:CR=1 FL=1